MTKRIILLSLASSLFVGCVAFPEDGYYDGRYGHRYDYDDRHDDRYERDRQRWEYEQRQNRIERERREADQNRQRQIQVEEVFDGPGDNPHRQYYAYRDWERRAKHLLNKKRQNLKNRFHQKHSQSIKLLLSSPVFNSTLTSPT